MQFGFQEKAKRNYMKQLRRLIRKSFQKLRYLIYVRSVKHSVESLVYKHFSTWSSLDHINKRGFEIALKSLDEKSALIIETGTSAWGTDSTRLWDTYIRKFGGELYSVDIREEASQALIGQMSRRSRLIVDDSVSFLSKWNGGCPDLYYLDSWDLDLAAPY